MLVDISRLFCPYHGIGNVFDIANVISDIVDGFLRYRAAQSPVISHLIELSSLLSEDMFISLFNLSPIEFLYFIG